MKSDISPASLCHTDVSVDDITNEYSKDAVAYHKSENSGKRVDDTANDEGQYMEVTEASIRRTLDERVSGQEEESKCERVSRGGEDSVDKEGAKVDIIESESEENTHGANSLWDRMHESTS